MTAPAVITIRNVDLPEGWQLDPATLHKIARMRRHQIRDATQVWIEAERLVNTIYHRPAKRGASSSQETP